MVHDVSTSSLRQLDGKNAFRQVCDKPCANRIIHAEWSPMRDLIAVITSNGEVRLHRMYWQKVWLLPATTKDGKDSHATSLAWKYNGRLLAIGYDNGSVQLVEIEKSAVVHSMHCKSQITSLCWIAQKKTPHDITYNNCSEKCLPETNCKEELKKEQLHYSNLNIGDDDQYSVLVVGNNCGEVYLFIEGVYPALHVSVKEQLDLSTSSILSSHLSVETGIISVICKGERSSDISLCDGGDMNDSVSEKSSYYLHQFQSELLSSRGPELSHLAVKFIKTRNTIDLCGTVLKQMADASEDVCVKINSKLEKLEQLVTPMNRNVASEFTIAYATGRISAELSKFLTQHLTAKGLKQIAQNVQSAYVSLRCDVGELDTLTQQLLCNILELQGIVSWREKFGLLGLSLDDIQICITAISQFRLKMQELLDVISSDMKNFSVFFTWLKLCQAGSDFTQVAPFQLTNDEYDIMLDFLEHRLCKIESESTSNFDLERVSQYFKEGELTIKTPLSKNPWYKYVQKNELLNKSNLIIKPDIEATLLSLYKQVKKYYDVIFNSVSACMSDSVSTVLSTKLYNQADGHEAECQSRFSFIKIDSSLQLLNLPCTCDSDRMFMIGIPKENCLNLIGLQLCSSSDTEQVDLNQSCPSQYTLRDVKFYNKEFVTVLAEVDDKPNDRFVTLLGQVPISHLLSPNSKRVIPNLVQPILEDDAGVPWVNLIGKFSELRRMEAFRGKQLSVNGYSRKVSSIISMSGRRIRIFDMTADDDEMEDSKMEDSKLEDSKMDESRNENSSKLESESEKDTTLNEDDLKIEDELHKVNISISESANSS